MRWPVGHAHYSHYVPPINPLSAPPLSKTFGQKCFTPDRLNSLVFGVLAMVALAIAVVGVAGCWRFR